MGYEPNADNTACQCQPGFVEQDSRCVLPPVQCQPNHYAHPQHGCIACPDGFYPTPEGCRLPRLACGAGSAWSSANTRCEPTGPMCGNGVVDSGEVSPSPSMALVCVPACVQLTHFMHLCLGAAS